MTDRLAGAGQAAEGGVVEDDRRLGNDLVCAAIEPRVAIFVRGARGILTTQKTFGEPEASGASCFTCTTGSLSPALKSF
jgi:hypothetical protein